MNYLRMLIITLLLSLVLHAETVSVSYKTDNLSILDKSGVLITSKEFYPDEILTAPFQPAKTDYINLGLTTKHIWVRFTIENRDNKPLRKLLVVNNPLLIFVDLFQLENHHLQNIAQKRKTLAPSFMLTLPPQSKKTYYLHVKSLTSLKFGLSLYTPEHYLAYDREQQLIDIFLLGIIATMLIYNLLLYFFIKERSYLYYSLYLLLLIAIEASYLGFATRYLPYQYLILDNRLMLAKVELILVFYILYSVHFLKLHQNDKYRIFKKILFSTIVLTGVVSLWTTLPYQTRLQVTLILVLIAVHMLLAVSIVTYLRGGREVRFYILGFLVVYAAYIIVVLDALGIVSLVYHMQNILIAATAVEAIFLSVAFIDNYTLVQTAKLQKEHQLFEESQHRESLIQKEVAVKTDQLHHAMTMQELLFNELHHRVKNNLQLILSITRMQKKRLQSLACKRCFQALEQRIGAIAATHNTIYLSKELEIVSMKEYLTQLIEGLRAGDLENKITFEYDINLNMVLKNAINIGLIVNELISNALKHAFGDKSGTIHIRLQDGLLEIRDNGKGFDPAIEKEESLGMRLVQILVKDQLKGSMNIATDTQGTKITIRFAHA